MLTVMVCTLGGLFHHYTENTKCKLWSIGCHGVGLLLGLGLLYYLTPFGDLLVLEYWTESKLVEGGSSRDFIGSPWGLQLPNDQGNCSALEMNHFPKAATSTYYASQILFWTSRQLQSWHWNGDKRTLNWNIIVLRMDDIVFEGKLQMALAVCVCNYENASMLSQSVYSRWYTGSSKIACTLYFGCNVQPSICSVKMGLDL